MNIYDVSKSVPQATSVPTQPWTGTAMPAISQYPHLLINQQHSVAIGSISIEAAARQAAARAAEISKLLERTNDGELKQKLEEPATKRESVVSKSHSPSQSHSRSSKSKSASPIRYRSGHTERERYSPRDQSRYRTYRHSTYYFRGYNDRRGYRGSNYRRYSGQYRGREYSYYRSRSRRSPSQSRSRRYRHDESRSPRHRYSPTLRSDIRRPARDLNRHNKSRSPVKSSSMSSSPRARIRSPRKPVARSLSSSRSSQSGSISNLSMKDNPATNYRRSSENNSEADDEEMKNKNMPFREPFKKRTNSKSSSSTESTSLDHSDERAASDRRTSASEHNSTSSMSSGKGATPRASSHADYGSDPAVSSPQRATNSLDGSLRRLDHRSNRNQGVIEDQHDEVVRGGRQKLSDSTVERKSKLDSIKPSGSKSFSPSRDSFSKNRNSETNKFTGKERDLYEEAEHVISKLRNRSKMDLAIKPIRSDKELAHSFDVEMDNRTEGQIDCWKQPEDKISAEISLNKCSQPITGATNQEYHSIGVEHTIIPLPDVNENMDQNMVLKDDLDEFEHGPEYHIRTPVRLPDVPWVETEQVNESPTVYQYPENRPKRKSRSRERRRKLGRTHPRKSRRKESEDDEDHRREIQKEQERKVHGRRHRRYSKSRSGSKRRGKHWDASSSFHESSSSSENDDCKRFTDVPSKSSKKK